MAPRLHVELALAEGAAITLPPEPSRHVQVLRLQPGHELTLFDGRGGEWAARIERMTRHDVQALVGPHRAVERELPLSLTLAPCVPAGDRMDAVIEKATELGATAIQPLASERSVVRLSGDRAERRRARWQAIAIAACEQCGRNRVPRVHDLLALEAWIGAMAPLQSERARGWLLTWRDARPWRQAAASLQAGDTLSLLSGPEGGLTPDEEAMARARGFEAVSLGSRVLRADTAPLAALAALAAGWA
jgi:16S rRNA (uracil1498-N3)-methyltransferase